MSHICYKLRSRSGASMIIALVFLLFCMFIGSAVLASASANGARAAKQMEQQQAYLDQRSAALLLTEQLRMDPSFHLIIKDTTTVQELGEFVGNDWDNLSGSDAQIEETRKVTFEVHASMNPLQRVLVESAILRYLEKEGWPDFEFQGITNVEQLSCYSGNPDSPIAGSFRFEGISDSWAFADFSANLSCDDNYHFLVDFGAYSQLSITVKANAGTSEYDVPARYADYEEDPVGHDYVWQICDKILYSVITWGVPQIEKEGAV